MRRLWLFMCVWACASSDGRPQLALCAGSGETEFCFAAADFEGSLRLPFGSLTTGGRTTKQVRLRNEGDAALTVLETRIDPAGAFSVASAPTSVEPGGTAEVSLAFAPTTTGVHEAKLVVRTNDPERATIEVRLVGRGSTGPEPQLCALPDALALGSGAAGEQREGTVVVSSCGEAAVVVDAIAVEAGTGQGKFALASNVETPFELAPGQQLGVKVRFTPGAGATSATLRLGGTAPLTVGLSASVE